MTCQPPSRQTAALRPAGSCRLRGRGVGGAAHTGSVSDLFADAASERAASAAPLASRLRPRTLDDFVGQRHILGERSALRLAIAEDRLRSVIFYGPPGSG